MKSCRFFFVLWFAVLAFVARAVCAQTPLGSVVAFFPYNASRLLADPIRNRLYAAVPASNGVVIDTAAFQVLAVVPTGQNPVDLAISPDANTDGAAPRLR